jgi:hypothetical protein
MEVVGRLHKVSSVPPPAGGGRTSRARSPKRPKPTNVFSHTSSFSTLYLSILYLQFIFFCTSILHSNCGSIDSNTVNQHHHNTTLQALPQYSPTDLKPPYKPSSSHQPVQWDSLQPILHLTNTSTLPTIINVGANLCSLYSPRHLTSTKILLFTNATGCHLDRALGISILCYQVRTLLDPVSPSGQVSNVARGSITTSLHWLLMLHPTQRHYLWPTYSTLVLQLLWSLVWLGLLGLSHYSPAMWLDSFLRG